MRHTLLLRRSPPLRVDARWLQPLALAAMTREQVLRLSLPHGNGSEAVGEWFGVASQSTDDALPQLRLEGDLSRIDCIAAGMTAGRIEAHGPVGDGAGMGLSGGELRIHGDARHLTACAMRGGLLEVLGDVGDFAASALPGEMDGMRGGTLVVHGNAGARMADRMRRGTVVVHGGAGDFLASRMVAGTIALGGRCGAHPAWGMRRGSIVFAGEAPQPPASFVTVPSEAGVIWQLLARELSRFGGRFEDLPRRRMARWAGDLAVQGQGEWLLPR